MKRVISWVCMIALLAGVLCTAAFAAVPNANGVYALTTASDVTVEAYAENGTAPIDGVKADLGGEAITFYADAVKFDVSYAADSADDYHLVLALSGENTVPTKENIVYIDQTSAENGTVAFTVYPSELTKDETYHIYRTQSGSTTGLEEVASFTYFEAADLGDVDGLNGITAADAMYALQISVGLGNWEESEMARADVDGINGITATDALWILQAVAGLREI
ncbi:MAG: hypothetical protein IIV87_04330 [Oscillospiraceae bacterium]|nr:hypothetical protein [Oscillospiraceae bacterium]